MRYVLDTNVLLRLPHRLDPLHLVVRGAVRNLRVQGHALVTFRQNAAEFWNVCTRPATARGGFGLTTEETAHRLRLLERAVMVLSDPPSAYQRWKRLVVQQRVSGVQVHDARIAAAMASFRIRRILTLNAADFARFKGIEAITPHELVAT
jgi:predicted nucleic acid-binding protein